MSNPKPNKPEVNYYAVLECTESATQEQLKQSFQKLVKQYHPDKGEPNSDKFLLIDQAYKVLKDEDRRKDYDASLMENRCKEQTLVYAEIYKNQVKLDEEGMAYHPCRCGENFIIIPDYLEESGECLVECLECSNTILLK